MIKTSNNSDDNSLVSKKKDVKNNTEIAKSVKKTPPTNADKTKPTEVMKAEPLNDKTSNVKVHKTEKLEEQSKTRKSLEKKPAFNLKKENPVVDNKKAPVEAKKIPQEAKKAPVEAKKIPQVAKKAPVEAKKIPQEVKKAPVEAKKIPQEVKKAPVEAKKIPQEAKKAPLEAKKIPQEVKKAPLIKYEDLTTPIISPSILKAPLDRTPIYMPLELTENKMPTFTFEKIVANEEIIKALKNENFIHTTENMQKILQSVLRNSDVLSYVHNFSEMYLIAAIGAVSKFLSGNLTRAEAKKPVALILCHDEKKLTQYYKSTVQLFSKLGMHFALLPENISSEDCKTLLNSHIDILFATVTSLEKEIKNVNLESIGVCYVYDLSDIAINHAPQFHSIINGLPKNNVQKVFLSQENNPSTREFAFSYLDNIEYFYMLNSYIKERIPKQFAHALVATKKFQVLLGHLKNHKPNCAVVFANTKSVAEWIAFKLHGNGIKVELITSFLNSTQKQNLIESIKTGEFNIIVTTDYHCQNLGIENLNCIYQFDIPEKPENYFNRLNLIEKAKSPICVSFICEDYGYNMGKIEDAIGFKIHVIEPDKNYANIKDESEYPLEADGRVKKIGQTELLPKEVIENTIDKTMQINSQIKPQIKAPSVVLEEKVNIKPMPIIEPPQKQAPQFIPKTNAYNASANAKFENKSQDKFIRRDDKAKEALDNARMAAQEKKKLNEQKQIPKLETKQGWFSVATLILQDALQEAKNAAKKSVAKNIETHFPQLSTLVNTVFLLKKDDQ